MRFVKLWWLLANCILTNGSAKVDVRFEGFHYPFVARVPDSQGLIVRGTDDKLATGMEDDAANPVVVSHEGKETNTGTDVPYTNYLVSRTRCEERSFVGTLVVCSCRSIDRCPCTVWCPCNTFHYVFVVSEFHLNQEIFVKKIYWIMEALVKLKIL